MEAESFRLALFIVSKMATKVWCHMQMTSFRGKNGEIFLIFTSLFKNKETFPRSPLAHLTGQDCTKCSNLGQSKKWNYQYLLKKKVKLFSRVWLFVTLCTVAYQATPSMGFSKQEYWSGLPFPSPGYLPDPGIEPRSTHIVGRCFTIWATSD